MPRKQRFKPTRKPKPEHMPEPQRDPADRAREEPDGEDRRLRSPDVIE